MSYHGKLQTLKNGTADAEIQLWAYQQLEKEPAELTDEDRSMLIRTLKWSEDLLRVAGHDEAVSDVQDCLMIIRKAQEK